MFFSWQGACQSLLRLCYGWLIMEFQWGFFRLCVAAGVVFVVSVMKDDRIRCQEHLDLEPYLHYIHGISLKWPLSSQHFIQRNIVLTSKLFVGNYSKEAVIASSDTTRHNSEQNIPFPSKTICHTALDNQTNFVTKQKPYLITAVKWLKNKKTFYATTKWVVSFCRRL